MSYYGYFKPSRPIETDEGIKARSKRGAFAENWWAQRWIQALERITDCGTADSAGALMRGTGRCSPSKRKRARSRHGCKARGRRPTRLPFASTPFTDQQWEAVIDALAERAILHGAIAGRRDAARDRGGLRRSRRLASSLPSPANWRPIVPVRIGPTRASTWPPRTTSWASSSTRIPFCSSGCAAAARSRCSLRCVNGGGLRQSWPKNRRPTKCRRKRRHHWPTCSTDSGRWVTHWPTFRR